MRVANSTAVVGSESGSGSGSGSGSSSGGSTAPLLSGLSGSESEARPSSSPSSSFSSSGEGSAVLRGPISPFLEEPGAGICGGHYEMGGGDKLDARACAEKCEGTPYCNVFSVGGGHGCRVSKCGSEPGPDPCPADKQCAIQKDVPGKVYRLDKNYRPEKTGICDWHYSSAGKLNVRECADKCEGTADCKLFSVSAEHGCRISKCGSDPGPDPCPKDNQCPTTAGYGGKLYRLIADEVKAAEGVGEGVEGKVVPAKKGSIGEEDVPRLSHTEEYAASLRPDDHMRKVEGLLNAPKPKSYKLPPRPPPFLKPATAGVLPAESTQDTVVEEKKGKAQEKELEAAVAVAAASTAVAAAKEARVEAVEAVGADPAPPEEEGASGDSGGSGARGARGASGASGAARADDAMGGSSGSAAAVVLAAG